MLIWQIPRCSIELFGSQLKEMCRCRKLPGCPHSMRCALDFWRSAKKLPSEQRRANESATILIELTWCFGARSSALLRTFVQPGLSLTPARAYRLRARHQIDLSVAVDQLSPCLLYTSPSPRDS